MCHAPGYGTDSSENPTIDPGTRELEEDASATMSTIDFRSIGWNCAVRVFTPSSWLHAGCCYERLSARNKARHAQVPGTLHDRHDMPVVIDSSLNRYHLGVSQSSACSRYLGPCVRWACDVLSARSNQSRFDRAWTHNTNAHHTRTHENDRRATSTTNRRFVRWCDS